MGTCGLFDISCQVGNAIDSWLAGLARDAVGPLFTLLGNRLLSTPQVGGIPAVHGLWAASLAVAGTGYVLLVLAGGITVMGHETVQTAYSAKEIAPRLVVGFAGASLSLMIAGKAIALADAFSAALAVQGQTPAAVLRGLTGQVLAGNGVLFILLAVFAAVLIAALALIWVARLMLTVVLVAVAPLALACHGLPQTEHVARWWWRAFTGTLAIQSAQALVLSAAARVFFTQPWTALASAPGGQAGVAFAAVQLICLLYILVRIPFWIYHRAWHASGHGPLRQAARFVFAAAVLRRITPYLSGRVHPPPRSSPAPPAPAARPPAAPRRPPSPS